MADYTLSARVTGDASGFNRAFQSAQDSVKNLGEKTKELGSKISDLGKSMSTTITPALAGIGAGAMATASEFESSTARIQNALGLTAEGAEHVSQVAKDIYKRGFGESLPEVEKALIQVRQNMKNLEDGELEDVIVKAQVLGQTFDADVNEVTRAGNNIMTAFGTSSKKAFDLMAQGAQNGLNFSNEMFDNLSEYAPLFGKMGFSAEEYFQLLQKGSAAGVYNLDYINDVMKEFQIRVKDNSKATNEAMASMSKATQSVWKDFLTGKGTVKDVSNAVLGELKGMDNQVNANNIGVALFGTKWEDLEAEAMYALGGIDGKLGEFDGAMNKMIETQEQTFGQQFQSMLRNVKASLVPLGEVLNDLASKALPKISAVVALVSEKFESMSTRTQRIVVIVGLLLAALGPLLIILGTAVTFLGTVGVGLSVLISPITLVIAAILALVGVFGYLYKTSSEFRAKVTTVFESFKVKAVEVAETVKSFVNSAVSTISGFASKVSNSVESAGGAFGIFMTVFDFMKDKISAVITTISGIFNAILPIFATFVSSISNAFSSAGGVGSGFILQILSIFLSLNPVVGAVMALFKIFGKDIVGVFETVATMVIPLVQVLGTAIGRIASAVIPVFMQVLATLIPVVVQLATAFTKVITMVLPILINMIMQIVPLFTQLAVMISGVIAQVVPLVGTLISALIPTLLTVITVILNIVQSVFPVLIAIIGVVIEVVEAMMPVFMAVLTVVIEVIAGIIAAINPIIAFIGLVISAIMAIIAPIITFIAMIITSIISVIKPIIATVSGIFTTVVTIAGSIFRGIVNTISSVVNTITSVVSKLTSAFSNIFNNIRNTVSSVMTKVSSIVTGVFNGIKSAWSGLTGFVNGVFNGISTSVGKLVGQVKGFVNGVIGGINKAVGIINKIPGVEIKKIPQLYRGTDDWQGGFARMNEGGRGELVNLPNGAQVIPHDVSMKYAREAAKSTSDQASNVTSIREGDVVIRIEKFENHTDRDLESLSYDLGWMTKRERGRLAYE